MPAKVDKDDGLGWDCFLKVKFQWENPLGGEGVCPTAPIVHGDTGAAVG